MEEKINEPSPKLRRKGRKRKQEPARNYASFADNPSNDNELQTRLARIHRGIPTGCPPKPKLSLEYLTSTGGIKGILK